MIKDKKMLILVVDRDNDLYEKAKMVGPVIGREANLNAAMKLALADPQDTDTNAIYQAIKIHDELSKDNDVVLVCLTGSKKLGYQADKNIGAQLDKVLMDYPAESAYVVTDGADDSLTLPIIESRIKIDSVKIVVMKQAKELEKTYVVLLEKLRDPYYSRIIFGIPTLLLLMGAFASYMNWGWEPIALVMAIYLLQRLIGIDEKLMKTIKTFQLSVESSSFILYLSSIVLIIVSIWMASQTYTNLVSEGLETIKLAGKIINSFLLLFPAGLLLAVGGKMLDLRKDKNKVGIIKYGFYAIAIILIWTILSSIADWIILSGPPYTSFQDVLGITLISMVIGYSSIYILQKIRVSTIGRMKLENKEVIEASGMHLGKVVGVEKKKNAIIVQGPFTRRTISIESIIDTGDGDNIVVKL